MADHYILRLRGDREDVGTNYRGITIFSCRMVVLKGGTRYKNSRTVSAYHKAIQYEDLKQYKYPINLFHDAKIQCLAEIQHLFVLIFNPLVLLCNPVVQL